MSDGGRIPLDQARALADDVVALLRPAAKRIEIAGSIRRGKLDIGDIEIVAQTALQADDPLDALISQLRADGAITPKLRADGKAEAWGARYLRALYNGRRLDVFIVRPDRSWGVTYLIRTGPGDANQYLVTRQGGAYGAMPPHLMLNDGNLYRLPFAGIDKDDNPIKLGAVQLDLPEEADVFAALGMPYVEPHERTVETYARLRGTVTPPLDVPATPITVYTARLNCGDPDALEITVGGTAAGRVSEYGIALSPTRELVDGHKAGRITDAQYTEKYLDLLRWRWTWYPHVFMDILASERLVLTCYCAAGAFCHRHLAVDVLRKIAAQYGIPFTASGELTPEPEPVEVAAPVAVEATLPLWQVNTVSTRPASKVVIDEQTEAEWEYNANFMTRCYPGTDSNQWLEFYASGFDEARRPVPRGTPITKPKPRAVVRSRYPNDGVLISECGGEIVVTTTLYGQVTVTRSRLSDIVQPALHVAQPPAVPLPPVTTPIMALTLYQPWASAVFFGLKHYETRSWADRYRGWVVIHAGKTFGKEEQYYAAQFRDDFVAAGCLDDLPLGVALGVAYIADIQRAEDVRGSLTDQEKRYGGYADGRYAWKLEHVRAFPKPISCAGKQKLWCWDEKVFSVSEFIRGLK